MYLQLVHGGPQSSTELRSIIGQEAGRASPQRDEVVHQNVRSALGGEFGCGDGEHVARRLKRSLKRRMYEFPRAIVGRGQK